jgi:hypothetical protein
MYKGLWWGNLRGKDYLEDPVVDGRVRLIWIVRKGVGDMDWIDLVQDRDRWLGTCECGNKLSGSIKCGEFLD